MQYTVDTAMRELGCKNKKQLADKLECTVQTLYTLQDGKMGSRLNKLVKEMIENKQLKKRIYELETIIISKDYVIAALK